MGAGKSKEKKEEKGKPADAKPAQPPIARVAIGRRSAGGPVDSAPSAPPATRPASAQMAGAPLGSENRQPELPSTSGASPMTSNASYRLASLPRIVSGLEISSVELLEPDGDDDLSHAGALAASTLPKCGP